MTVTITRKPKGTGESGAPEVPPSTTPPASAPAGKKSNRPLVEPRAPSSSKWKQRVILETLDGKIAWEKMNPEGRKAFEELFRDEKFLKQFGVTKEKQAFTAEQMKSLYDGLSMMYQTVVAMLLRWPKPVLELLAYTAEEKEMLAEPTANLVNRFAPSLVMQNKEILIWLGVFGAVTQKRFSEATNKLKEIQKQAAQNRGPVVVPRARAAAAGAQIPPLDNEPGASLDDAPVI